MSVDEGILGVLKLRAGVIRKTVFYFSKKRTIVSPAAVLSQLAEMSDPRIDLSRPKLVAGSRRFRLQ